MVKIKVYDVNEFVKKNYPEYEAFRYEKAAIFEGANGVVFAEREAVHKRENLLTDSVQIPLCKKASEGHIAIMASAELTVSLAELVAGAPCEEMNMEDFFTRRNYNPRCQENYAILLNSLRSIGLDPRSFLDNSHEQVSVDAAIDKANELKGNQSMPYNVSLEKETER